jgi:hypothetical protein
MRREASSPDLTTEKLAHIFKTSKIHIISVSVAAKLSVNESGFRSSFRGLTLGKMLQFFLFNQV